MAIHTNTDRELLPTNQSMDNIIPVSVSSVATIASIPIDPIPVSIPRSIVTDTTNASVNRLFWSRSYILLRLGIQNPIQNPKLWLLILINITAQLSAGYIAQSLFYYTGTGTGANDPGMAGCLKKDNCTNDTYKYYLSKFAWTFALLITAVSIFAVTGDLINNLIRYRITVVLQSKLLTPKILLYRIELSQLLPNYDERLTSDLQLLLDGLCCALFGNTADYLSYPVLFCISRCLFSFINVIYPPNYPELGTESKIQIVGISFLMAIIALLAYILPMNHISKLFYSTQKSQAEFRSIHSKSIINSESICFYNGESTEANIANKKYREIEELHRKYYLWQTGLMFIRLLSIISQPTISYFLLSISGANDVSYASAFLKQQGDVLEYLLYFPAIIARLAFAAGSAHRLGELMECIDSINRYTDNEANNGQYSTVSATTNNSIVISPIDSGSRSDNNNNSVDISININYPRTDINYIELINVTASPPVIPDITKIFKSNTNNNNKIFPDIVDKHNNNNSLPMLFNNLSLRINPGNSIVIMGDSGCGKSSLLRIIAGLWPINSGSIIRPNNNNNNTIGTSGLFFLPQKSYIFTGTLIQQITYPYKEYYDYNRENNNKTVIHNTIINYCKSLDLMHLINNYGLNTIQEWNTILSISEKQRLSYVRLFYHRPAFCLADESTSGLDLLMERLVMNYCLEYNITLISVAHRPSLIIYHKQILKYNKLINNWELININREDYLPDYNAIEINNKPIIEDNQNLPIPVIEPTNTKLQSNNSLQSPRSGFNLLFLRRLLFSIKLVIPTYKSRGSILLYIIFTAMIICGIIQIIQFKYFKTDVIINKILIGDTNTALNTSGIYLLLNLLTAILQALSAGCGALFGIYIHTALINTVHNNYYSNNVLYSINNNNNNSHNKLDSIDGRIVSDLNGQRESLSWIVGNPFAYLNYRLGLLPLAIIFIITIIYSFTLAWSLTLLLLSSIITALIVQIISGRITSKLLNKCAESEGILRSHYIRIKYSIESITFFNGLNSELDEANKLLSLTIKSRLNYSLKSIFTVFPTIAMYYWLSNGEYFMASIIQLYTVNKIEPSLMLTTIGFCVLIGKLGHQLVQSMGGLGTLAVYTNRINEVIEESINLQLINNNIKLKHKHSNNSISISNGTIISRSRSSALSNSVTQTPLLSNINFEVNSNLSNSLLLMGPSGCGKSSITRILLGLIDPNPDNNNNNNSIVSRPLNYGNSGIFFIPQSNYVSQGSLAEQIIYPHQIENISINLSELEIELITILTDVKLDYLISRWGLYNSTTIDWYNVLSVGEIQRLGFARMFYHKPAIAVLDESTSALDLLLEKNCMKACRNRNITLLSISTRLTQKSYHSRLMKFDGNGSYKIEELN